MDGRISAALSLEAAVPPVVLVLVFMLVDVQMSNILTLRNDAAPIRGNQYNVLSN